MSVFTDQITVTNVPLPIEGGNPTAVKTDGSATTQPVSGSVSVSNFPATQPVSGTLAVTQSTSPWVVSGTVTTTAGTSNSATITQNTSTGANQTILAANANRKKAILFFTSGSWFVKFGSTASNTSFTYSVSATNTTVEIPVWVGQIDAICTTAGKFVNVTELV